MDAEVCPGLDTARRLHTRHLRSLAGDLSLKTGVQKTIIQQELLPRFLLTQPTDIGCAFVNNRVANAIDLDQRHELYQALMKQDVLVHDAPSRNIRIAQGSLQP